MRGELGDFSRRLTKWYHLHRRDLPWRLPKSQSATDGRVNPYHVFISEAMLQQTQVATVIPYFTKFIQHFGTFESLAEADEQEVLRLWQGLGYYSRARNLRKAAIIVARNGLPTDPRQLLTLPGVGRYTAGAIASIAFGKRCPILDGNVVRVLCRIDAIRENPTHPPVRESLWERAAEILPKRSDCGDFNSALMELGATVCTPRSPKCLICPVNRSCQAYAAGIQQLIPVKAKRKQTPVIERFVYCIRHSDRWLIEQRPDTGRWAGLWQFVTRPTADLAALPLAVSRVRPLMLIEHALTHRRYRFQVSVCETYDISGGIWSTLDELRRYPMSKPHVQIASALTAK